MVNSEGSEILLRGLKTNVGLTAFLTNWDAESKDGLNEHGYSPSVRVPSVRQATLGVTDLSRARVPAHLFFLPKKEKLHQKKEGFCKSSKKSNDK